MTDKPKKPRNLSTPFLVEWYARFDKLRETMTEEEALENMSEWARKP